jgi:hypothetical protein
VDIFDSTYEERDYQRLMSFPTIDYHGPPIFIPQFSDHLHLGIFIEFEEHPGLLQVGCIIRQARDVNNFYVDFSYDQAYGAISPNLQNLNEIQQTSTTRPIYIKHIKDIAFVFAPEDVTIYSITLTSQFTHGYLVRFNTTKVNNLYLPVANHIPFPCIIHNQEHCFEQCIALAILQSLKNIRNAISSILSRGSASLSDFNRDTKSIPLSLRGFNYLRPNLHFFLCHTSSHTNTLIDVFGTKKRQRTTCNCYLFHCETILQLGMLNNLLAGGCLIGNRSPPPKFGSPPRHLHQVIYLMLFQVTMIPQKTINVVT